MTDDDIRRLARAMCEEMGIDPDEHAPFTTEKNWIVQRDFARQFLAAHQAMKETGDDR